MSKKKYKLSDVLEARTNTRMLKDCPAQVRDLFAECPYRFTVVAGQDGTMHSCEFYTHCSTSVYRISSEWPPEDQIEDDSGSGVRDEAQQVSERYFNPSKPWKGVLDAQDLPNGSERVDWYELTEAQRSYLQDLPHQLDSRKWVLQVPEQGDGFIPLDPDDSQEELGGIRWVLVPRSERKHCSASPFEDNAGHKPCGSLCVVDPRKERTPYVFRRVETWTVNGAPFDPESLRDLVRDQIAQRDLLNEQLAENEALLASWEVESQRWEVEPSCCVERRC